MLLYLKYHQPQEFIDMKNSNRVNILSSFLYFCDKTTENNFFI